MKVQELMRSDVKTCRRTDTLDRAAQIMWDHDCGCVPVVDWDLHVVGMITDRDVCMGAYTKGRPLWAVLVSTAMSQQVWFCRPEDTIAAAERILKEKRIRRLPVVEASGRLVGILSLNDIACEAARERMQKRKDVSDAEIGEVVASICEPRAVPQMPPGVQELRQSVPAAA